MKKTNTNFSLLISIFLFASFAHAETNFVTINLPTSVSVDVPRNWVLISNNQRITLDTWVESTFDLAKLPNLDSRLPFAANYYVGGTAVGIINARYYPTMEITQNDVIMANAADVRELDQAIRKSLIQTTENIGLTVTSWEGTEKRTLNGITTFITEYHRKSLKGSGIFRVRLVRVFAGSRSFTLTVSYLESQPLLRNITDRIISSLTMSDHR